MELEDILPNLEFIRTSLQYGFYDAQIRTEPGYKTQVYFNEKIEPSSPEFWGVVLRAGYVQYQYKKGLQLAGYDYKLYENDKNKPRKPRTKKEPAGLPPNIP